jgi:two-component system chemotaxis response regulator CheB
VKRLRVLVVEDSLTVRSLLVEVLGSDPGIEVVASAGDGRRGIELCEQLRPDLVTMDMMLPQLTGLAATEYIMAYCPTPILVVSSSFERGEVFQTFDALAAGAVDVLEKPRGDEPEGVWEARFLATVKLVARVPVITHPRHRLGAKAATVDLAAHRPPPPGPPTGPERDLVALGASTGGPSALVCVLSRLPVDPDLPVLLVLHIGEPFGIAFAEWLDGQTRWPVGYALHGQPLPELAGRVAMAPPGRHLVVDRDRLWLSDEPERHSCRPSVDVLFESVARERGSRSVACLLTGMGRDGAAGLAAVRRAGGHTIAQDEATSVVYGMPREAALLGAAERILPLDEIGAAVGRQVAAARRHRAPIRKVP